MAGDYVLGSDYSTGSGGLIGGDGFGIGRETQLGEGEDGELLPQTTLTSPESTVSAVACFQLVPDERYGILYSLIDGTIFSLYLDMHKDYPYSSSHDNRAESVGFPNPSAQPTLALTRPHFRYASGFPISQLLLYGVERGLSAPSPRGPRPRAGDVPLANESSSDEFSRYALVASSADTLGLFSLTISALQDAPGTRFLHSSSGPRSSDDCYALTLRQQGPSVSSCSLDPAAREIYNLCILPVQNAMDSSPEHSSVEAARADSMLVLDTSAGLRSVPLSALSPSATFPPRLLTDECGIAGFLSPACTGSPVVGEEQPETIAAALSSAKDRSFACLLRFRGEKLLCTYKLLANGERFASGPGTRDSASSYGSSLVPGPTDPGQHAIVDDLSLPFILKPRQFVLRFSAPGEVEGAIKAPGPPRDLLPDAIGASDAGSLATHTTSPQTGDTPEFTIPSRSPLNPNHVRIESLREAISERTKGQKKSKLGPGAHPSGYGTEAPIVPAFEAARKRAREREARKAAQTGSSQKARKGGVVASPASSGRPIKPIEFDPAIHETNRVHGPIKQRTSYSSTCPFPPVFSRALSRGKCSFLGSDGSLNFYSIMRFETRQNGEDGKLVFDHAISPGYHFSSYSIHLCGDLVLTPGPKSTCDLYRVSGTLKKPLLTLQPKGAFPHETSFASFVWPQHDLRGLAVSASACSFNVFYYSLPGPQAGMDEAAACSWTQVCSCKIPASVCAGAAFSKVKSAHVLLSHMGLDRLSDSPSVTIVDLSRMQPITAVATRNSPHKRAPGVLAVPDFLYPGISRACQNLFATSACGADGGEVAIYDVRAATRAPVRIIRGVNARRMPAQVSFMPGFDDLTVGGEDGRIRVYDLGQGKEIYTGPAGPGAISSLCASDGGILYAGFLDGGIQALTFQ